MTGGRWQRAALALLVVALGACAGPGSSSGEVELAEFYVTSEHDTLKAGTVELTVENYGEFTHTLVVSDASGAVIAATDQIEPDADTILTIDVEPGAYTFTCRIVKGLDDGTVVDHYQRGMVATVEVVA